MLRLFFMCIKINPLKCCAFFFMFIKINSTIFCKEKNLVGYIGIAIIHGKQVTNWVIGGLFLYSFLTTYK